MFKFERINCTLISSNSFSDSANISNSGSISETIASISFLIQIDFITVMYSSSVTRGTIS